MLVKVKLNYYVNIATYLNITKYISKIVKLKKRDRG